VVFFQEWSRYRDMELEYSSGDSWDRMLQGGFQLLDRFAQEDRVRIRKPRQHLQVKFSRPISSTTEFVAYVDAIGEVNGQRSLIDWKTTSARYPDDTDGLLGLDPQLLCYSWITREPNVAFVVFVRKRMPEIQYLQTTISEQQRAEFGLLVKETIRQIESGSFLPHSGIRFPQNGCLSCAYQGLCLAKEQLIDAKLIRRMGEELAWLDELAS